MAEILTTADLTKAMTDLVPERCRNLDEICPVLGRQIAMWGFGFDYVPAEEKTTEASQALESMQGIEDSCKFGLGEPDIYTNGEPRCQRGQLCSGFGGAIRPLLEDLQEF